MKQPDPQNPHPRGNHGSCPGPGAMITLRSHHAAGGLETGQRLASGAEANPLPRPRPLPHTTKQSSTAQHSTTASEESTAARITDASTTVRSVSILMHVNVCIPYSTFTCFTMPLQFYTRALVQKIESKKLKTKQDGVHY